MAGPDCVLDKGDWAERLAWELRPTVRWTLSGPVNKFPSYIRTQSRFKIPARAAWMTAAADDDVLIR